MSTKPKYYHKIAQSDKNPQPTRQEQDKRAVPHGTENKSSQKSHNENSDLPPVMSECTKVPSNNGTNKASPKGNTSNESILKQKQQATWLAPGKLTTQRLEHFVATILPTSVQVQLDQPFGKDSLQQSFYSAKSLCHILLPLLKSGFLSCRATKALEKASYRVRQLQQLRKKYVPLDFRSLQGYQQGWEETATIRDDWKAMTSACALHFNGDIATVVRFIGGPHVHQHINTPEVLAKLKPVLTKDVYDDVDRILTTGAPAYCNAEATNENFNAYLNYGNHKSARENPDAFRSTIVKQSKRGLTLIMDPALVHFTLNTHLTPQGLVDILHHRRKPRPVSDSSFRPWAGAHSINDWTSKVNEPPLHFADSFQQFCIWHWNLAISYPRTIDTQATTMFNAHSLGSNTTRI
ncbi:hypothetical protein MHU86_24562 [Fragilaria crotonensis]|nr:hypothetical protein MHU86_24562 [Fragilaria crotonensis]